MKKLVMICAVAVCVALVAGQAQATLVAHWQFEEASGILYDATSNNNDGSYNGALFQQPGQVGYSLGLDGTDDYVDCGNGTSLNIIDEITVAAWVKTNDAGNSEHNPFVMKGDFAYGLKHENSNRIQFFIYDEGAGDPWRSAYFAVDSSFNDDWHHVAGTYDGSSVKLYIDGILEDEFVYTGSISSTTSNVNIGRNSDETTRFFNGTIDEVRIYNHALTLEEVTVLATMPEPAMIALLGLGSLMLLRRRR